MNSESEDVRQRLDASFKQASQMKQSGDSRGAEALFRAIKDSYEEAGFLDRQAMVSINIAQLVQQRGDLEQSEREYRAALSVAESISDQRRAGLCLGGLATIAMERGELSEAESLNQRALALFEEIGDQVGVANQLGNLGLLKQGAGQLESALDHYTRAAQLFVQANNVRGAIGVLQCVGELHRRQGEIEEAEDAHQKALSLAEKTANIQGQAYSHRALGQLLRLRGQLAEARGAIERGMACHKQIGDSRGELAALIDLGTIAFGMGKGEEAMSLLDRCIERSRRYGMVTPLIKALLNRALYRLDTEQIESVAADLAEALPHLEKLGDPAVLNIWSITSARVAMREGRWDEAEELLKRELERSQEANLAGIRPAVLGLLASLESVRGNNRAAIELFTESEALYRAVKDQEGSRHALLGRARALSERGALEQSLEALDRLWGSVGEGERQPVLFGEVLLARASVKNLRCERSAALVDLEQAIGFFREARFVLTQNGAELFRAKILLDQQRFEGHAAVEGLAEELSLLVESCSKLGCPTLSMSARVIQADLWQLEGALESARSAARSVLEEAEGLPFPDGVAKALEVLARVEGDRELALRAVGVLQEMDCTVRAERIMREWNLEDLSSKVEET